MDVINLDKYAAVRYAEGGRDYPALDCFGLVLSVRQDMGLPEWPDYRGITKHGGAFDRAAREFIKARHRTEPVAGAIGFVETRGLVTHAVVCVAVGGLLYVAECNPDSNVTISLLSEFSRKNKTTDWWI